VVDEAGAPVPGAKVAVVSTSSAHLAPVTADGQGAFELTKLPMRGEVLLLATHPTKLLVTVQSVDPSAKPAARLVLQATGTLTGRIIDGQGDPLAGGTVGTFGGLLGAVMMWPADYLKALGIPGRVPTDADGKFRLPGLPAGVEYQLGFFPPGASSGGGFAPKITPTPGQTVDVGVWVSKPNRNMTPQPPATGAGAPAPAG
jgi:hypothetical protein